MVEEMLLGWMVGLVLYVLFMARDAYQVCYAPVHPGRSRHAE